MADVAGHRRSRTLKDGFHHPDLRMKIIQFLTGVGKFAVDSTIFNSLMAATGKNKVHKIIWQGGLKDIPHSSSLNDKKPEELKLVMDKKMQAEMEEAEERKNKMKQHHCTSANIVYGSEPLKKFPGEGAKGSANTVQNDKKRIFIRSRL
ncbi:uncharacterized protein LOC111012775 [Momordica charantia]|uniref:Uncharacterized protein LOC111012775 n=1 Tax=Momordica charantia TaxID=3673 RepID=A0A6J1CP03_MOMCH|nr:uncharacterized protein LOC111012775 [Momordica charantia]